MSGERVQVATWLSRRQADRLREIAEAEDRSVSSVIRRLVVREFAERDGRECAEEPERMAA